MQAGVRPSTGTGVSRSLLASGRSGPVVDKGAREAELPRGGPGDREALDAALEVGAQERGCAGVAEGGGAGKHLLEQGAHLGAGQVGAKAKVRAVAEHQVRVGLAADVE